MKFPIAPVLIIAIIRSLLILINILSYLLPLVAANYYCLWTPISSAVSVLNITVPNSTGSLRF